MDKKPPQPFIAAACQCFQKLSQCPELKNYRIYREPEVSRYRQDYIPSVKPQSFQTTKTRHKHGKWILVVSAIPSSKASLLDVKVQGYRYNPL